MTLTTVAWVALLAAAGTTAVRSLRHRPAPVRVRQEQPTPDDENWHPHVTSGCGR
jgi:hypothetical protein